MSGSSNSSHWPEWLKPGSANKTFAGTALIALLALGAWTYWQQTHAETRVSLLPCAKLLEHDLGRMQLAFGDAALNDYEIRAGQIWVPQSQRDRFLKALNTHDALPESSREIYEPDPQSPWSTRQQQQEINLLRKKKMIRQLVLQLDFVAEAIVDYDELVVGEWPPTTRRSAAIVVHPKSGRLLESFQVDAIRHTICGAVAGLQPGDIVITDIAAGHAYVGSNASEQANDPANLVWLERAKLEQRIDDQLSQFGCGIESFVSLEERDTVNTGAIAKPQAKATTAQVATPIANQPTAIGGNPLAKELLSTESTEEEKPSDRQVLTVRVRVPEKCVREFAPELIDESKPSDATLEREFEVLRSRMRAVIQPLLVTGALGASRQQIDISLLRDPLVSVPSQPALLLTWSKWKKYLPAAIVGFAIIVTFAWVVRRPKSITGEQRSASHLPIAGGIPRESFPMRTAENSLPDDTRRKLKQMVDDDPDQAAEIIKQWIRGAA